MPLKILLRAYIFHNEKHNHKLKRGGKELNKIKYLKLVKNDISFKQFLNFWLSVLLTF